LIDIRRCLPPTNSLRCNIGGRVLFILIILLIPSKKGISYAFKLYKIRAGIENEQKSAGKYQYKLYLFTIPDSVTFFDNWFAIAYGVNVGGNGIVIASLAIIIALRFINEKKTYLEFHKYSLLYLAITGGLTYVLFFL